MSFRCPIVQNQNDQYIVLDVINYPVVTYTYTVKPIIALHLCMVRIWQILCKSVDFIVNTFPITLRNFFERFRSRPFKF